MDSEGHVSRRSLLRFIAASPLFPFLGFPASVAANSEPLALGPDSLVSVEDAVNVFDFEISARQTLPPAHYGYLASGVDGDETLRANREGFERFDLRARRLVDVSKIDMSVELLGQRWDTPIVLAPVGSQKAFHPEGELAAARASNVKGCHQILSTVTTTAVEAVNTERTRPVWYQLYPSDTWEITKALVHRAEAAGCEVLVLTVDLPVGSNRETFERYVGKDTRDCSLCHEVGGDDPDPMNYPLGRLLRKPMFQGLDMREVTFDTSSLTWDFIRRLKDLTEMKVMLKGIVRDDDAQRCLDVGADGIIVSNHGGRAEPSGRSTIESLPEIVNVVRGRIPVLVDSGFRRGTDILKALALGADAICIGRPYIWGMATFGQEGIEAVLDILRAELRLAMQLHGVSSLADLDRSFVTG